MSTDQDSAGVNDTDYYNEWCSISIKFDPNKDNPIIMCNKFNDFENEIVIKLQNEFPVQELIEKKGANYSGIGEIVLSKEEYKHNELRYHPFTFLATRETEDYQYYGYFKDSEKIDTSNRPIHERASVNDIVLLTGKLNSEDNDKKFFKDIMDRILKKDIYKNKPVANKLYSYTLNYVMNGNNYVIEEDGYTKLITKTKEATNDELGMIANVNNDFPTDSLKKNKVVFSDNVYSINNSNCYPFKCVVKKKKNKIGFVGYCKKNRKEDKNISIDDIILFSEELEKTTDQKKFLLSILSTILVAHNPSNLSLDEVNTCNKYVSKTFIPGRLNFTNEEIEICKDGIRKKLNLPQPISRDISTDTSPQSLPEKSKTQAFWDNLHLKKLREKMRLDDLHTKFNNSTTAQKIGVVSLGVGGVGGLLASIGITSLSILCIISIICFVIIRAYTSKKSKKSKK